MLYLSFAISWILVSDHMVAALASDRHMVTWLQTIKGWIFVALTAGLLLVLTYRSLSRLDRSRRALEESDAAYRRLFADHPHPMWVIDARTARFLAVNDAALRHYDYQREDFQRMTAIDLHVPEEQETVKARLAQEHPCDSIPGTEWRHRTRSGRTIDVEISCHQLLFQGRKAILVMILDITERKRLDAEEREARNLLAAQEARYRILVAASPVGIFHFTPDLRIGYANPRFGEIFSLAPGGTPDLDLIRLPDGMLEAIRTALSGQPGRYEGPGAPGSGEPPFVSVRTASYHDTAGHLIGGVGIVEDITQRRQAETAMRSLNLELERRVAERTAQLNATAKELEAFCYSVSHDLRAPLRAIDGYTSMLEGTDLCRSEKEVGDLLRRIRAAVGRMGQLIEDLLALSQVSQNDLIRQEVDLSSLAAEIWEEIAQGEPQRPRPHFHIQPDLHVHADPRLMRVMLENLLGNAWKFTARTQDPHISFTSTPQEGVKVFMVEDNGAGFDMRYRGNLFRPFQRLHHERDFPGNGIGLATVARIIHRHGGEIWAEGSPNWGARFNFTLDGVPFRKASS